MIPYVLSLIAIAIFALALVPRRLKRPVELATDFDGDDRKIHRGVYDDDGRLVGLRPYESEPVEIFDAIGRIDAISRSPIAPTPVVIAPAWDDETTPVGKVEVMR